MKTKKNEGITRVRKMNTSMYITISEQVKSLGIEEGEWVKYSIEKIEETGEGNVRQKKN